MFKEGLFFEYSLNILHLLKEANKVFQEQSKFNSLIILTQSGLTGKNYLQEWIMVNFNVFINECNNKIQIGSYLALIAFSLVTVFLVYVIRLCFVNS